MAGELAEWAYGIAEAELAQELPRRWAHSQGVGRRAASLAPVLGEHAELLHAAALLHDVGYAPRLANAGFHPLDGARFLRDEHNADAQLVRLVANHSCALLEAAQRALDTALATEFPLLPDHRLVDALIYCDMTTTPDGELTTAPARIAEILNRYGPDSLVARFIHQATPEFRTAVTRIESLLASRPARDQHVLR